jgi:glutamine cyclotransferase
MAYTMTVVETSSGVEHELPADTVTRDVPLRSARGPLIPLAYRPSRGVFYVTHERWPELGGVALRLRA